MDPGDRHARTHSLQPRRGLAGALCLGLALLACGPAVEPPASLAEALEERLEWQRRFAPEDARAAEALGRGVWEAWKVPGFAFARTARFACGGQEHWIVLLVHEATGLEFALLPGGEFWMGSPAGEEGRFRSEDPRRRVRVRPFLLCRTEVPNGVYRRFRPAHQSGALFGSSLDGESQPAVRVNWEEAAEWCREVGLRLPSEAEWEYACRAGTSTARFWGDGEEQGGQHANLADQTARGAWPAAYIETKEKHFGWRFWNSADGQAATAPVGSYRPNAFGLFDMIGNVWEWCQDTWHDDYQGAPDDGSARPGETPFRVSRGGAWNDSPRNGRSADRGADSKGARRDHQGFRPAGPLLRGAGRAP